MNLKEIKIETVNENLLRLIVNTIALNFEDVDKDLANMKKQLSATHIDHQQFVRSNDSITPSIGCKVAYDKYGLILKSMQLDVSDIPQLSMNKIDGLKEILESKITTSDIRNYMDQYHDNFLTVGNISSGYGIDICKDGNDMQISIDLKASDIPQLSFDHIKGLKERLEILEASFDHCYEEKEDTFNIEAGTYPKVSYDEKGRIISGSKLSIDDIPNELLSRMNELEGKIPLLASQKTLDSIHKNLSKKLDQNNSITPGTYTKIKVDAKGLVLSGDQLTIHDLPKISIQDIDNLDVILRNKVDYSKFIEINNLVSSLTSSMQRVGEVINMKSDLQKKADQKDVKEIIGKVNHLEKLMDTLSEKIPNELIMEQFKEIQKELSNLSGRISVLENKLDIK